MFKSVFEYRDNTIPLKYIDEGALEFILTYINPLRSNTKILDTSTIFNIEMIEHPLDGFVNLRKINYIHDLNRLFKTINDKLYKGGIFVGSVETYSQRKNRIYQRYPGIFAFPVSIFDFFLNRVIPKLKITKGFYNPDNKNLALSKSETFGRLHCCGFEVIESKDINNVLYFAARKVTDSPGLKESTNGLLLKMERVGKGGKSITVYKLRTMNPYAEYIQGYVYNNHNLKSGGKFKDDFRITSWGRIFRKYWIDELPMVYNLLKGEIKIVGVRPLSKHYFDLYDPKLKEKRYFHKPGLIPPFYADMPDTLDEIMKSEMNYFNSYETHPFKTDTKYLFRALYNIFLKKARSS